MRELRGLGLTPDLIMCRCKHPVTNAVKQKVSLFCHVPPEQVIDVHDCKSIYRVPLLLSSQGIVPLFSKRLKMEIKSPKPRHFMMQWRELAEREERVLDEVKIALVGKYTKLEDAYISVLKALKHASLHCNRCLKVVWVESENIEKVMQERDPVKYHEAWQKLCSCE